MADTREPWSSTRDSRKLAIALDAIRERWRIILITTATAAGAAVLYSSSAPKRYEAEADVLVTPIANVDPTYVGIHVLREGNAGSRSVLTAARLVRSPEVRAGVKARIGGDRNELLNSIRVTPQQQSDIITITGIGADPMRAAAIANAFAEVLLARQTAAFSKELRQAIRRLRAILVATPPDQSGSPETAALRARLAELRVLAGTGNPNFQIVSKAVPPEQAVWPRTALSIGFALMGGLLLGTGAVVVLRSSSSRVLSEYDLPLSVRSQIFARVPSFPAAAVQRGVSPENRSADLNGVYAGLITSLESMVGGGSALGSLLITSTTDNEGKSITAANLATTALEHRRVLVFDGDTHGVTASGRLRLSSQQQSPPLHPLSVGDESLAKLMPGYGSLAVIRDHQELLQWVDERRVSDFLHRLCQADELLILDCPPAGRLTGALISAVDVVVVVVRVGRTRRDRLEELMNALNDAEKRNVAIVFIGGRRLESGAFNAGNVVVSSRAAQPD